MVLQEAPHLCFMKYLSADVWYITRLSRKQAKNGDQQSPTQLNELMTRTVKAYTITHCLSGAKRLFKLLHIDEHDHKSAGPVHTQSRTHHYFDGIVCPLLGGLIFYTHVLIHAA